MKRYVAIVLILLAFVIQTGCMDRSQPSALRVALPYSDHVLDTKTNYYIEYLENKIGLEIETVIVRQDDGKEYLDALSASDSDIDIVFFGEDFVIDEETAKNYADKGYIHTAEDGTFWYPNYGSRTTGDCGQILWINYEWLERLGLSIPTTTSELREVLFAFKNNDPNGNGLNDEIALIGSTEDYCYDPAELLLNSYVYNDPYNNRLFYGGSGALRLSTEAAAFREGMVFLRGLYKDGLLDTRTFSYSLNEMNEVINANIDIVGAFTTDFISNVIYQANPEVLARYIHVAPLAGPEGVRNSMYREGKPMVGAVINARSAHISDAERLIAAMLSEEASLIARYGEPGVDWERSDGSDVSIYGTISTIVTKNYIWNTPQNKHLNGIGPMYVPDVYLKGVTWNGLNSDAEYVDARAQVGYSDHLPERRYQGTFDAETASYTDRYIYSFITGERDVFDDNEWGTFVQSVSERTVR